MLLAKTFPKPLDLEVFRGHLTAFTFQIPGKSLQTTNSVPEFKSGKLGRREVEHRDAQMTSLVAPRAQAPWAKHLAHIPQVRNSSRGLHWPKHRKYIIMPETLYQCYSKSQTGNLSSSVAPLYPLESAASLVQVWICQKEPKRCAFHNDLPEI